MSGENGHSAQAWLDKALEDWSAVEIMCAHPRPPFALVCFHCQQFVEKLFKAFLTLKDVEAPRTHSIGRLIQLAEPHLPRLEMLSDTAAALSAHGVMSRYPDDLYITDRAEMNRIIKIARQFGDLLTPELNPAK